MTQKNSLMIGISLVIAIVLIVAAVYFKNLTAERPIAQSSVPVPIVNETLQDWKEYTDVQYGFSFRYPGRYATQSFPPMKGLILTDTANVPIMSVVAEDKIAPIPLDQYLMQTLQVPGAQLRDIRIGEKVGKIYAISDNPLQRTLAYVDAGRYFLGITSMNNEVQSSDEFESILRTFTFYEQSAGVGLQPPPPPPPPAP